MVPNFEVISNKFSIDTICTLSSSHEQNKITVLKVISVELDLWKRKAGSRVLLRTRSKFLQLHAINIWVCTWTANSPGKTIYTRKENKWI
jgi:hypothetical protein